MGWVDVSPDDKWISLPTDTRNSRGVTNALPDFVEWGGVVIYGPTVFHSVGGTQRKRYFTLFFCEAVVISLPIE